MRIRPIGGLAKANDEHKQEPILSLNVRARQLAHWEFHANHVFERYRPSQLEYLSHRTCGEMPIVAMPRRRFEWL